MDPHAVDLQMPEGWTEIGRYDDLETAEERAGIMEADGLVVRVRETVQGTPPKPPTP